MMELDIRNVAGIREGAATIEPGVNAVRGLNWQGKTSFVRAIETAMGTARALTEGQPEGQVELTTESGSTVVSLARNGEGVTREGTPYLQDEYDRICAALFAFLDDENEVREAVRRGENLEDVLTRPLAFADIDARLADLREERRRVETELEAAREAAADLPDVQETVTQLEADLDDLRAERDDLLADREAEDGSVTGEAGEELSEARAERSRLQDRIERLENATERIEDELADRRIQREELEIPEVDVDADLEARREELDALDQDIDLVQGLYTANKRIVEENRLDLVADVDRGLMADAVDCWVCGTETETDALEAQVEALGEKLAALNSEAEEYRERIEAIEDQRAAAERAKAERRDLDREIDDLEASLADRRESLAGARDQLADVEGRIDDLTDRVAAGEDRLTDLQSEIKYKENRLADERETLADLERRADQVPPLETTLEEIATEQEELRGRKSRVKQEMREVFDDAIGELVRQFQTSFESARLTGTFDLVVARDGREVSLDALSEGELELIGIVAALAGYEAYDVAERVPVLVLDGIGGLAEQNLKTLVEYLDGRSEYLVFTAYPEHTAFGGNELRPREWSVVSDEREAEPEA